MQDLEKLRNGINGSEILLEHSGLTNIAKRLKILLGNDAGLFVNSEKKSVFRG